MADLISDPISGVMCRPGGALKIPAEGVETGWIYDGGDTGNLDFVSDSRKVPAVIGIAMGVAAYTLDERLHPVTITVTHPPLKDSGVTIESWETDFNPGKYRQVYYEIGSENERVEGAWNISATYRGETLYSIDFELVAPETVPRLNDACTG